MDSEVMQFVFLYNFAQAINLCDPPTANWVVLLQVAHIKLYILMT